MARRWRSVAAGVNGSMMLRVTSPETASRVVSTVERIAEMSAPMKMTNSAGGISSSASVGRKASS